MKIIYSLKNMKKRKFIMVALLAFTLTACFSGEEKETPNITLEDFMGDSEEGEVKERDELYEEKEESEKEVQEGLGLDSTDQGSIETAKEVIKGFYKEELDFDVILSYPKDQPFEKYYDQIEGSRIDGYEKENLILFEIEPNPEDSNEIIHPANFIVVGRENKNSKWKVLDFGL